jgi:hypothetical protein
MFAKHSLSYEHMKFKNVVVILVWENTGFPSKNAELLDFAPSKL